LALQHGLLYLPQAVAGVRRAMAAPAPMFVPTGKKPELEKYDAAAFSKNMSQVFEYQWALMDADKDGFLNFSDAQIYMKALGFEDGSTQMTWNNMLRKWKAQAAAKIAKDAWIKLKTAESEEAAKDMVTAKQNPNEIFAEETQLRLQLEAGLKAKK